MGIKYFLIAMFLLGAVQAKKFSEEIIQIQPVSWQYLQTMQKDSLKMPSGLKLSESCPDELAGFEHLTIKNTVFKEILWSHYFWTEFEDEQGEVCLVKHETIDFFSKTSNQNPLVLKAPEFEILNKKQSAILLNAVKSVEYDDVDINVLKRNISNHNQAVDDAQLKKYGGDARMLEYMRKNEPEVIPKEVQKIIDGEHDSSTASLEEKSFMERFESYYTKESLGKFAEEVKNNPTVDRFNGKYPFNSMSELLESVKNDVELIKSAKKPLHREVKSSSNIYQIPNNDIARPDPAINGQRNPIYPYASIGLTQSLTPCPSFRQGSAYLITSYVAMTAAHNITCNDQLDHGSRLQLGLLKAGQNYFQPFRNFKTENVRAAANYSQFDSTFYKAQYDYGVIRSAEQYLDTGTIALNIDLSAGEVRAVGYPKNRVGMHEGKDSSYYAGNAQGSVLTYEVKTEEGMSGGPILEGNSQTSATYAKGVHGYGWFDGPDKVGSGVLINDTSGAEIVSWLWKPTGKVRIDQPTVDLTVNLVVIPAFEAVFNAFNKVTILGEVVPLKNVNDDIEWISDIDGSFASGSQVPQNILKNFLSAGVHNITARVDSNGEEGEKTVRVTIEVPDGSFNSNDFCIINLSSSPANSCQMYISWSVTNTPATSVVWNETDNVEFGTGNSGSQSFTATTDTTTFKLYPSDDKIILLDSLNAQAKTPTGTLSTPASKCSLQPSPVAPDGTRRDPKATPPGCGTELSWSNVQWASPSIFYRPSGSVTWQFLHEVSCALDGEVCSGSIHTDDYVPELISESGYQFKLVQFNDANSGNLTAPFTVSAKRYADVYEFDDGFYDFGVSNPNNQSLAATEVVATNLNLNETQLNHNFHRPAVYDSEIDVDTFDIKVGNLDNNDRLEVKLFNMANDLRVGYEVKCIGNKREDQIGGNTGEKNFGVWDLPESQIVSTNYNPNTNSSVMKFNVVSNRDYVVGGPGGSTMYNYRCLKNRIVLSRTAGQAGENLSYSIEVTNPNAPNPDDPILDSVTSLSAVTYKVELIGDNLGVNSDSSVIIRENIAGSEPLLTYSSDYFHNYGIHVSSHQYAGKDYIRFPILENSHQTIFKNNGLCFQVRSSSLTSNEKCFKLTARANHPDFMGAQLQSYNPLGATAQDLNSNAYVVNSNGNFFKSWGNSWKKLPVNYTVTPQTEFTMEYKSTSSEGEIIGVGFIMAGQNNLSGSRFWQLHGTPQTMGWQEHNNYSGTEYKAYTIKVGQQFTGQVSHMVFVTDYDHQQSAQNAVFRLPELREAGTDIYDDVPAQRAFDDDTKERAVSWGGGDTVHEHTFHDTNDVDWTIVLASQFRVRTELVGAQAGTNLSVYRWISASPNKALGYYENVVDELIATDTSPGASTYTHYGSESSIYAFKVEPQNTATGADSAYRLIVEQVPPFQPDEYDDVPNQRAFNDDVNGQASNWVNNTPFQIHNFHDQGDVDWTIINAEDFRVRTELLGSNADTRLTLYKWISATPNQNLGYYVNVQDQLISTDNTAGSSEIINFSHQPNIYAAKVESRNGAYAEGTDYKLIFSSIENAPVDSYETGLGVAGFTDDTEGTGSNWSGNSTIHHHNFHDNNDVDWTLVYANNFTVIVNPIGEHADLKVTVYKWDSASTDQGYYTNIVKQQVGLDNSPGGSTVVVNQNDLTMYSIKVESRNVAFGSGTNYSLKIQ